MGEKHIDLPGGAPEAENIRQKLEKACAQYFEYKVHYLEQARDNLLALEDPAPALITEATFGLSHIEQHQAPLSADERQGGELMERKVSYTPKYLRVGYRPAPYNKYGKVATENIGGVSLSISVAADADPEKIREALIPGAKKEVERCAYNLRNVISKESLAHDIKPYYDGPELTDERLDLLMAVWEKLVNEKIPEFNAQYETILADKKKDWEVSGKLAQRCAELIEQKNALEKDAQLLGIRPDEIKKSPMPNFSAPTYMQDLATSLEKANLELSIFLEQRKKEQNVVTLGDAELVEAMKQPAKPAEWYLVGIDPKILEAYGRKQGEGFGARVAGKKVFLPGDKPIVGIALSPTSVNRYRETFESDGILSLDGGIVKGAVDKRKGKQILGVVLKPEWNVRWMLEERQVPVAFSLANGKGTAKMMCDAKGEVTYFESKDWQGNVDRGPTMEDIIAAHHLDAETEQ